MKNLRMNRVAHILLLLALGCVAGCYQKTYPEEKERWGPKQWKQAQFEHEQRLRPEEQRKQKVGWNILKPVGKAVGGGIAQVWNYITGNTPFNAAKEMLDPASPDRRRKAVVYLSKREFGRREPYTKYYQEMARTDPDHTVRAMAIRALNRARYKAAAPVFISALEDAHPQVRLEAAKALANMPDETAVPALIRHLEGRVEVRVGGRTEVQEESADVRIACADAMRSFRTSQSAQALVRVLRDKDHAVSWQSRQSLKLMTGQDYRYDQTAWLTYLTSAQRPFG